MAVLDALSAKQLVVVTGKGGVGKTAVSSALASHLAASGRRTLILEIDPRESVHQMLGVSPSGGEILRIAPRLHLQHLEPREVLDQVVRDRVRIEFLIRRVLDSPVYHHFSAGAPGLKEMAVLGHSLLLVQGRVPSAPEIDVVVLDAPATGHGVSLLLAPLVVSEVIRQGPIAAMTAEVAEWVADRDLTGVVVVTLAEEMPVTESLELIAALRQRLDRDPEMVIANALYPPLPAAADGPKSTDWPMSLWAARRRLNDLELQRLCRAWKGPIGETPFLPLDRGPELTAALQERLGAL
jgi:anion-transporting  ArsA/GET3 family ATPase